MAQIVPKLNLNKTPSLVDNNSLIFAKNIRLDVDGSIHKDYGILPMTLVETDSNYIKNYSNIINRIIDNMKVNNEDSTAPVPEYYNILRTKLTNIVTNGTHQIVGYIASSNEFYVLINGIDDNNNSYSFVICYDESLDKFYPCNCNWNYSGGTITGYVINNLIGDKILCIGETKKDKLIPFKCINLTKSSINDDESIYTQTPNIPITNLNYSRIFNYVIPNGVYQFFIRYKIRNNFYTNWFPASKEIFVGNNTDTYTSFGSIKYVNTHRDSDNSFTLSVEHLFNDYKNNFESFQIGFIVSHDDEIVARAWKHFDFNVTEIDFDYKAKDAYEIEVIDLTSVTYQIYNVGNITSFKNKLYISNYTETDFNDNTLQDKANAIKIEIKNGNTNQSTSASYGNYPVTEANINNKRVISGIVVNGNLKSFNGSDGIFNELMNIKDSENTFAEAIKKVIDNPSDNNIVVVDKYDFSLSSTIDYYEVLKTEFINNIKNSLEEDTDIRKVTVDNINFVNTISSVNFKSSQIYNTPVENKNINITGLDNEGITNKIIETIYNSTRYLDSDGNFINNSGKVCNFFNIELYRNVNVTTTTINKTDVPPGSAVKPIDPDYGGSSETHTTRYTYIQKIDVGFFGDASKINNVNFLSNSVVGSSTLIPYQKYKFFIHYVKQNGEITNGYYCGGTNAGIKEAPYTDNANSVIYPIFSNINIPTGYVSCFFSILHYDTFSSTLCGIDKSHSLGESVCFDINTGLIPGYENIHIKQDDTNVDTITGKYYYSSDSSNNRYFGAEGIVTFDLSSDIDITKLAYVVNNYTQSDETNIELTKCTPFIKPSNLTNNTYDSFDKMNLLGYICRVNLLDRNRTTKYYTDGSSIFIKTSDDDDEGSGINFGLMELKNHLGDATMPEQRIDNFNIIYSNSVNIYSNYNLNFLTLSEDPKEVFKSYYPGSSNDTSNNASANGSVLLRLFSSLILSSIYTLPSMYKTYTKKLFYTYKRNEITKFDNTIRSSELIGDEESIDIFKFHPNDYYNIPTNRGIITNLISVGDVIIVHTNDSMFKFTGSNNLQSSDGEIQTVESSPFDTGVSEVFGSDFGFAGLQNKEDCIMTENGYIFFDRDSRIIYMYSGQGQIIKISDSIEKLFSYKDINNISFANDYYNNRFYVCITFVEKELQNNLEIPIIKYIFKPVTLSFNFSENAKAFVSLHDFSFNKSFNTKTKCYFITDNLKDICYINKNYKGYYIGLDDNNDVVYPTSYDDETLTTKDYNNLNGDEIDLEVKHYDSIVDIIYNENFETIKTLNTIKWCSGIIAESFTKINKNNVSTLKMAEDTLKVLPCKAIRVYTDTCISPLVNCYLRANNNPITSPNSYKLPRYNQGYWSYNYFRDIQPHEDLFGYLSLDNNGKLKYDDGRRQKSISPDYISDKNSLIEGKYFVIRFLFNSEFKLETLSLILDNKI